MEDIHDIRNRTFSFGAHGYNQDDVDRYLRELADRIEAGQTDWDAEIERFRQRSFAVVSLGYWRPDVDSYMTVRRSKRSLTTPPTRRKAAIGSVQATPIRESAVGVSEIS